MRLLRKKLEMPVGAYVSGPFTLAGLMIGANDIAIATIDSPEVVQATVNFCEHVIIDYAKALRQAGAGMICILEPTAMMLSPQLLLGVLRQKHPEHRPTPRHPIHTAHLRQYRAANGEDVCPRACTG